MKLHTSNNNYYNYYKNNKAIPNYSKNSKKISMCGYNKIFPKSLQKKSFLVRLKNSAVNLFRTKNQEKNIKANKGLENITTNSAAENTNTDKDLASINRNLASIITNNTAENVKVDRVEEFYRALMSRENILKPINKNKDTFAHCATYEE